MSDEGYVLNVASIAAFMPGGPLLASYYVSKAYVLSLSQSINQELKCQGKNISVSVLCPGPVNTEFNSVAGVKFNLRSLSAKKVARIAVKKMLKRKRTIIPGITIKLSVIANRFIPTFIMLKITQKMQKKKL
jgi:short-subunit dehydrogenase